MIKILKNIFLLLSIALFAIFATGCATSPKKIKRPEHIVVIKKFSGLASWYGRELNGRHTASGERFNMYALTAAHKTLPFGTKLRVTNLDAQKSVIVKVNDRGPFVKKRVLDLSYAAAKKIDLIAKGSGKVLIEVLQ